MNLQQGKPKIKTFSCKLCSMKCETALGLGSHMRTHKNHKKEERKIEKVKATPEQKQTQRIQAAQSPRNPRIQKKIGLLSFQNMRILEKQNFRRRILK